MSDQDNKKTPKLRAIFLIGQIISISAVFFLWALGFTVYASKDLNSVSRIILPFAVFGVFAFLWKLKSNSTKIIFSTLIKMISVFLSIGVTLTSFDFLGFNIFKPPVEFIQLNIWLFLTLISMISAYLIFRTKFITNAHYEQYPAFHVNFSRIVFLIPAHNEGSSIGQLVSTIKSLYEESKIVVVDNNSSDDTAENAFASGATVIHEWKQGKSFAIKAGFDYICQFDYDLVVMMDGDLTYNPEDALKMINYSASGGYGVILGSRLKGKRESGSLSVFNTAGNYLLTFFANILYGTSHSDICTGYWLFRKETIDLLNETGIKSKGFGLEAEMVSVFAQNNIITKDLPISYGVRKTGRSHLQPLKDGVAIFFVLIYNWVFSRKISSQTKN